MPKLLSRRDVVAWTIGIAALSVWTRLTVLPQVFIGGLVLPAFPDVHYHMRRIWQTLERFPHVPVFDPQLNWPDGGACPWPPGFDWLGAVFVAILGGASDEDLAARTVAFFPVLLGLLVVAATAWVARVLTERDRSGEAQVLAAGVLAAVLPQAVVVSRLGSVDHHVAEVLAMVLLGSWVLFAASSVERRRASWIRFELAGGSIAAFAGTVFNGSVLYVAIACSLLMALRLAEPSSRRTVGPYTTRTTDYGPSPFFGSGFVAMVLAACWIGGVNHTLVAEHGRVLDFRFPSYLQPLLHGVLALCCISAAFASRLFSSRSSRPVMLVLRALVLVGSGGIAAGLAAIVAPQVTGEVARGVTDWLFRSDPWLAGINEFQPLFRSPALWRPESFGPLFEIHGLFGVLAPIVLPVGLWRAWHHDRAVGACFAGWTLALVALTLIQTRFGRVLTPNLAVVTALTIGWALTSLAARLSSVRSIGSRSGLRGPLAATSVIALLMACDPKIREALAWHEPREPSALEAASLYLRSLPADGEATGGVLTKWDYGHTVLAVAKRPVVAAGFGPWPGEQGFREVSAAMQRDEPELMELMERRKLDYVVVGLYSFLPSAHVAEPGDAPPFLVDEASGRIEVNSSFFRARPLSSLILGGGGFPGTGVPHAPHLLPRFVSKQRIEGLPIPVFQFWVYERVPGAVLRGVAMPGARVVARTQLRVNGELHPYSAWTDAREDGTFELVVALPSALEGANVGTAPFYQVVAGTEVLGQIALSEQTIREGTIIDL